MESNKEEMLNHSPRFWLSLEHRENDPEFMENAEREFMRSPLSALESNGGFARREFLKLMGASLALTAGGCLRRPVEKIVPYAVRPDEITPGVANYYTSSWVTGGEGYSLVVKTQEGRPIMAEGHLAHPLNQGAMTARAHAHLLALYDPDRLQGPRKNLQNDTRKNRDTIQIKWEDLDATVVSQLKNGGVAVLTGSHGSPSTQELIDNFCRLTSGVHFVWDALGADDVAQGQKDSYGQEIVPRYRLDRAHYIISIDADFLGTWLAPAYFTREYSKGRGPGKDMSRLVVFESGFSLTGANSDTRIRIKPSQQILVAMGLAYELVVKQRRSSYAGDRKVMEALEPFKDAASELSMEAELFTRIADDIWNHRGESLVVSGGLPTRGPQSRALQVAVNFLNSILSNDGRTVDVQGAPFASFAGSSAELKSLIAQMEAGKIKTLLIDGTNPMYASPLAEDFRKALIKVGLVVYMGTHFDETGAVADIVATGQHPMECWSDAEVLKGLYTLQQPTIRPMYDTRSFQDSLMVWGNGFKAESMGGENFYEFLRSYWQVNLYSRFGRGVGFDSFWNQALQDGWINGARLDHIGQGRAFRREALDLVKKPTGSELELVVYPTVALGDGSLGNVSWLHDLPDPVTKISWDAYASLSMKRAAQLSLKEGDVVQIKTGRGGTISLPIHIQPGLHDNVITVPVGFGRTMAGRVGNGVGENSFALGYYDDDNIVFSGQEVSLQKTKKKIKLANTQGHNTLVGRDHEIVLVATLAQYLKDESAGAPNHHIVSIWPEHEYKGHKWGMSIDLNKCTGCSACMVACQSENNIPVVGKEMILEGREMHWIRIDRYYSGDPENPEVVFEPMLCQHCDNAPCETVCPVVATSHSDEGLNEMTYNRCVGTRYCANNCYYKVRRFNWFNYEKSFVDPLNQALNPSVTVRSRGVMEKCSFCVQRIKAGKNQAKLENRPLVDGEIRTACEASCPASAIVFGDINDSESRLSQLYKEKRNFKVLEELNAQPNVRYLAKIRNGYKTAENNSHKEGSHS